MPTSRRSQKSAVTCMLLDLIPGRWFTEILLCAPGIRYVTPDRAALGLDFLPEPYSLPFSDRADVALVSVDWMKWLATQGYEIRSRTLTRLRGICPRLVAFDGADGFSLAAPPWVLDEVELLIKSQGLYRDKALYNVRLGPFGSNPISTQAAGPRDPAYKHVHLAKLRLSLPCFVYADPAVRHRVRIGPRRNPLRSAWTRNLIERGLLRGLRSGVLRAISRPSVNLVVSLTHTQRLDALEAIGRAGIPGRIGITAVPDLFFGASSFKEAGGSRREYASSKNLMCSSAARSIHTVVASGPARELDSLLGLAARLSCRNR